MMLLLKTFLFLAWLVMTIGYIFFGYQLDKFTISVMMLCFLMMLFSSTLDSLTVWVKRKAYEMKAADAAKRHELRCKNKNHEFDNEDFDEVRPHVE